MGKDDPYVVYAKVIQNRLNASSHLTYEALMICVTYGIEWVDFLGIFL